MKGISKGRIVSYVCLLMIICILAFLVAKYVVRSDIEDDEIPIDTSTRM